MEPTASQTGNRFQTAVAIMIALVTLVGAIVAWRAALAAGDAGDADFAGLNATLNAEQTRTLNITTLYEHYRVYTAYFQHNELGNLIVDELDSATSADLGLLDQQKTDAWNIATANQTFFPTRFLKQDGSYDTQRELGEAWAEAGQQKDLNPAPHFAQADRLRAKSSWLVGILIVLAAALLLFTLAEGLSPSAKLLRYGIALGGTVLVLVGSGAAVAVEMLL
jgi:hypothetical protein